MGTKDKIDGTVQMKKNNNNKYEEAMSIAKQLPLFFYYRIVVKKGRDNLRQAAQRQAESS